MMGVEERFGIDVCGFHEGGWDMMCGFGAAGWGVGGWIMVALMLLFWLVVVGGIVAAIVFAGRSSRSSARDVPTHREAEQILHERFARGEIDEDEYVARRTALRHSHD